MKGGIHIAAVNKASVSPAAIAQSLCLGGLSAAGNSLENRTSERSVRTPKSCSEISIHRSFAELKGTKTARGLLKSECVDKRDLRRRTDTGLALRSLQSGELAQRQLADILPEGILFAELDGRLNYANPQAVLLLRLKKGAKLLGKTIFHLTAVSNRARLRADVAIVLKNGIPHDGEYLLLDGLGRARLMQVSVSLQRDARKQPRVLVFLLRDMSELRRTEQRMRELQEGLEEAREAVVICDLTGKIHYANQGVERLFGWGREELKNRTVRGIFFDDTSDFDVTEKELRRRGSWDGELRVRAKSGRSFTAEVRLTLVRRRGGEPDYVVAVASDVTERKRTEESLKEREQLCHTIIESALHGFWMVDLHGRLLDVNEAYCRMCGYTKDELLGMHIANLEVNEPSRVIVQGHIRRIMRNGGDRFETQHRRKDGTLITLEVSARYLRLRQPYLFAFLNDITERKRLENEERQFSRQLLEAQEAERSRMGRELHDGVNQIIASAKMRLRTVDGHMRTLGPACREVLARCDELLFEALNENRRIAHNLHPTDLSELGLAEACRNLCRDAGSRTSMIVKSVVPRRWRRLAPAVELNLFRIAQEGLRNVEQHARAKFVMLKLGLKNGSVVMKISDDGRGFKTELPNKRRTRKNGAGLANMQERAGVLGGTCAIVSLPRRGTTVSVRVPCDSSRWGVMTGSRS